MKIQYDLEGIDPLMLEHIKRNIDFDNVDLLFTARKSLQNIESSRMLTHLTGESKMIVESMKDRQNFLQENIQKMFQLTIMNVKNSSATLELFAAPEYFVVADSIEARFGRLGKRLIRFQTRQGIIDGIEQSLRKVYQVNFIGKIVDDDGKKLIVGKS